MPGSRNHELHPVSGEGLIEIWSASLPQTPAVALASNSRKCLQVKHECFLRLGAKFMIEYCCVKTQYIQAGICKLLLSGFRLILCERFF